MNFVSCFVRALDLLKEWKRKKNWLPTLLSDTFQQSYNKAFYILLLMFNTLKLWDHIQPKMVKSGIVANFMGKKNTKTNENFFFFCISFTISLFLGKFLHKSNSLRKHISGVSHNLAASKYTSTCLHTHACKAQPLTRGNGQGVGFGMGVERAFDAGFRNTLEL